jgi:hypothetical protein
MRASAALKRPRLQFHFRNGATLCSQHSRVLPGDDESLLIYLSFDLDKIAENPDNRAFRPVADYFNPIQRSKRPESGIDDLALFVRKRAGKAGNPDHRYGLALALKLCTDNTAVRTGDDHTIGVGERRLSIRHFMCCLGGRGRWLSNNQSGSQD